MNNFAKQPFLEPY